MAGGATPLTAEFAARSSVRAAGVYSETLTVQWNWSMCRMVNLTGICILSESGTGIAVINVTMTVAADCRIAAPPLNFGSASLVVNLRK